MCVAYAYSRIPNEKVIYTHGSIPNEMGYLSYYLLTTRLFFLVLRKSLRWGFTGESTTTIYSRFTSLVRYRCRTLLVYRDSLLVVARLQDTLVLSLTTCTRVVGLYLLIIVTLSCGH